MHSVNGICAESCGLLCGVWNGSVHNIGSIDLRTVPVGILCVIGVYICVQICARSWYNYEFAHNYCGPNFLAICCAECGCNSSQVCCTERGCKLLHFRASIYAKVWQVSVAWKSLARTISLRNRLQKWHAQSSRGAFSIYRNHLVS